MCSIVKVSYKVLGVLFNSFDRKYIKKILESLDLDDDLDRVFEEIEKLRKLYTKKLSKKFGKYAKDLKGDVDDYLNTKLESLGIDIKKLVENKYVNLILEKIGLDDEIDTVLGYINEMKNEYKRDEILQATIKKVGGNLDKFLKERLIKHGIDIDELVERKDKIVSKMGLVKIEKIFKDMDKVEEVSRLKDEKLLFDVNKLSGELLSVKKRLKQHKKDYKLAIEKHLIEKQTEMDEARVLMIKQEAIDEYKKQIKMNSVNISTRQRNIRK